MGQALYRKYRSKSLAEVVGQDHITDSLQHALQQGTLAHAYLFTGPRGVGKTSIARILAHEINGLPYQDDAAHLDIIEIDAASNRRIDEIRELRDRVNVAPSIAKYKVYIIDEVHMLTREAFNALLKTLEEPPSHVVFILATTESHKLPETIVSRTQRFIFRPVSQDKVVAHLRSIAEQEALTIDDEALALIAEHGEGSFRDSISMLDQARGSGQAVDADYIRSLIGIPDGKAIEELKTAINNSDAAGVSRTLVNLQIQGSTAPQIAKQLAKQLRNDVLAGKAQASNLQLLAKLLEVPAAHNPEAYLELSLLTHALAGQLPDVTPAKPAASSATPSATSSSSLQAAAAPAPAVKMPAAEIKADTADKPPAKPAPEPQPEPSSASEPQQLREPAAVDENLWPEILNSLKKSHNTLYGIARMARPTFYEDSLELGFTFSFHKKRLSENKNKDIITGVIKSLTGKQIGLTCVLVAKDTPFQPPQMPAAAATGSQPNAAPDISAISNIFGSAEVLNS